MLLGGLQLRSALFRIILALPILRSIVLLYQGVANRDLKLENLLLDRDGCDGTRPLLKICDFGYSKHEMNSSAKTGVGTPIYMAPEIIYGSNRYDAKARDSFSFWAS